MIAHSNLQLSPTNTKGCQAWGSPAPDAGACPWCVDFSWPPGKNLNSLSMCVASQDSWIHSPQSHGWPASQLWNLGWVVRQGGDPSFPQQASSLPPVENAMSQSRLSICMLCNKQTHLGVLWLCTHESTGVKCTRHGTRVAQWVEKTESSWLNLLYFWFFLLRN